MPPRLILIQIIFYPLKVSAGSPLEILPGFRYLTLSLLATEKFLVPGLPTAFPPRQGFIVPTKVIRKIVPGGHFPSPFPKTKNLP
jgi:hypothetical protein